MTKFESTVKSIPFSQETVYNKLSNLNNIETIKDRIPEDKVKDLTFDEDSISVSVAPVGKIKMRIIEREPHKCIKFESEESPMAFNVWIQLLPNGDSSAKMKITLGVDVNPLMKAMIQKPLQEGVEKLAEVLSMVNYQ